MRLVRSLGSPPKYISPSRSRISLSPLAVNGVLLLLTEMVPVEGTEKLLENVISVIIKRVYFNLYNIPYYKLLY